MEILSVNNDLVKQTAKLTQKKYRDEYSEFILEGSKAVEEWHKLGRKFKHIFVMSDKAKKYEFLNHDLILTNSAVLKKISSTVTEPEIVGVTEKIKFDEEIFKTAQKVVLLEGIKDAGNLGAIMRSAVAFGADALILFGDCTDIYNPKCIRSAAGNFGKIPVFEMNSVSELDKYFASYDRIATLPRSTNLLKSFSLKKPVLIMFGSEAEGLTENLTDYATNSVKIEMSENVESLNLSISCAVILYEFL